MVLELLPSNSDVITREYAGFNGDSCQLCGT